MTLRLSGDARRARLRLAALFALLTSTGASAIGHDPDRYPCGHGDAAEHAPRGAIDASVRGVGYADRAEIVSEGGVEAARRAHYLYDRSTAEQLDGRCERIVRIAAGEDRRGMRRVKMAEADRQLEDGRVIFSEPYSLGDVEYGALLQ
jgi:hypothetical protein